MSLRYRGGYISLTYDPTKVPDAPTIGEAAAGDTAATVPFTAPTDTGGSAITGYSAISTPGNVIASSASSPITFTGLTNGTSYTFKVWAINSYGPSAYSASSNSVTPDAPSGGDTALFWGGETSNASGSTVKSISTVDIATTGNSTTFGDLYTNYSRASGMACGNYTRGLYAGGVYSYSSPTGTFINTNIIQYVTFASSGNATYFGDLNDTYRQLGAAFNSSTRAVFACGSSPSGSPATNAMSYVTIASTGDASDFGDSTYSAFYCSNTGMSDGSRGVFLPSYAFSPSPTTGLVNAILYVTIASTGDTSDFGDLLASGYLGAAVSNSTRGLVLGGFYGDYTNVISYITMASTGDATDFGDLNFATYGLGAACNPTRAIAAGGFNSSSVVSNTIDYVTIASTGNATDFGDMVVACFNAASCSNGGGGA